MGYKNMIPAKVQDGGVMTFAFEFQESIATPSDGDWILIPDDIRSVAVALNVTTGTGKIQTTVDSVAKVQAGTATPIDWDDGVVAVDTADVFAPVTAVRQVNASGTTEIQVRAQ